MLIKQAEKEIVELWKFWSKHPEVDDRLEIERFFFWLRENHPHLLKFKSKAGGPDNWQSVQVFIKHYIASCKKN